MESQKMIYALRYFNDGSTEVVKCYDLDKIDYQSKYRGHLRCINGCKARIKFTQRKDNYKFFSTWNDDGNKHNKDCPYCVIYDSVIGRKKIVEYYEGMQVDDEHIENTLYKKAMSLMNKYNEIKIQTKNNGSEHVQNVGSKNVLVYKNEEDGRKDSFPLERVRIQTKDASYLTLDDVERKLCIY